MAITWKDIPGYEGHYQASSDGRVRSLDRTVSMGRGGHTKKIRGCILRPTVERDRWGHLKVGLRRDGKTVTRRVHSLVMLAFVGEREDPSLVTCHGDGNPANNHLCNLRYDTQSNNSLDAVRHGTHPTGSKTHCPKNHEYTAENTLVRPRGEGRFSRTCLTCKRAAGRKGP
ncbi:NUMOD4 domain-containing protein [Kribbella italica]|uniref:NUMOD4 domain-containing protein n=1 Tax=Kribbella italica TaxID=1540520 RepID=A0A7W9J0L5_9ACTN|nr:hypothetical protein [Kribbella italica]